MQEMKNIFWLPQSVILYIILYIFFVCQQDYVKTMILYMLEQT